MPRKPKSRRPAPDEPSQQLGDAALRRISRGKHVHIAEIHGEAATAGLTRWAQEAVLPRSGARA